MFRGIVVSFCFFTLVLEMWDYGSTVIQTSAPRNLAYTGTSSSLLYEIVWEGGFAFVSWSGVSLHPEIPTDHHFAVFELDRTGRFCSTVVRKSMCMLNYKEILAQVSVDFS